MKLGLGTVQFGLDYGVSNPAGRTPEAEVIRILEVARQHGVSYVDTAAAYGESEAVLGRSLRPEDSFRIITKTWPLNLPRITAEGVASVERAFEMSLTKLGRQQVYGLLLHAPTDVLVPGGNLLWEYLTGLKQQGRVAKIGASVYDADQIDRLLKDYPLDIIQAPINIFDQRLRRSGHLERLKQAGIEIHARSVFLQGLLLMEVEAVPEHLDGARQPLDEFQRFLRQHALTPVQAALGFVNSLPQVDAIICGVNDHLQLQELCASAVSLPAGWFDRFAIEDRDIVDPSLWPRRTAAGEGDPGKGMK
jgi:aryl-alcohol dehydrogenase-like predicted oxidoreductase